MGKKATIYFDLAHKLNKENKDKLKINQMHFRGSLNSISLISISDEKPEIGKKINLKETYSIKEKENLVNKNIELINLKTIPHRPTPEKKLQSWIIKYALHNDYKLPFDNNLLFITSEIAIQNKNKKKIINDILAYDVVKKQICIIELKSTRSEKELIKQVTNFEEIINENLQFFSELLFIHGFTNQKNNQFSISKMIIWPYEKTSTKKKLKELGIIEVTYTNNYTFQYFK